MKALSLHVLCRVGLVATVCVYVLLFGRGTDRRHIHECLSESPLHSAWQAEAIAICTVTLLFSLAHIMPFMIYFDRFRS
jgi:hypothetical protein